MDFGANFIRSIVDSTRRRIASPEMPRHTCCDAANQIGVLHDMPTDSKCHITSPTILIYYTMVHLGVFADSGCRRRFTATSLLMDSKCCRVNSVTRERRPHRNRKWNFGSENCFREIWLKQWIGPVWPLIWRTRPEKGMQFMHDSI